MSDNIDQASLIACIISQLTFRIDVHFDNVAFNCITNKGNLASLHIS